MTEWAGGFYDGEGSISCRANNGNPFTLLQLSIGQKNDSYGVPAETLIKFQQEMGVGKIYPKSCRGKDIDQSQFLVTRYSDVMVCIEKLWPFIGTKKRNQITVALEKYNDGQKALDEKLRLRGHKKRRHIAA